MTIFELMKMTIIHWIDVEVAYSPSSRISRSPSSTLVGLLLSIALRLSSSIVALWSLSTPVPSLWSTAALRLCCIAAPKQCYTAARSLDREGRVLVEMRWGWRIKASHSTNRLFETLRFRFWESRDGSSGSPFALLTRLGVAKTCKTSSWCKNVFSPHNSETSSL